MISILGCRCDTETKRLFEEAWEKKCEDVKQEQILKAVHVIHGVFKRFLYLRNFRALEARVKMKLVHVKFHQKIVQLRTLESSLF